ncbi:N-acetyl neuramic acid synthetase NeuB, partial [Escherichia coli]
ACNLNKDSFARFIRQIAPYTAHLHLVDAKDVDGEGLQIGEGDIDFDEVSELLKQHAPTASFIPEIWQGHKNNGEGFWIALERLEQFKS